MPIIWPLILALAIAYGVLHKGNDTLDCAAACQDAQEQAPLVVEPIDHEAIFGPHRTGKVTKD